MRFAKSIPVLLLCTAALRADDPRFGLQGALVFPTNNLSDVASLGFGFGGHATWDFGRGHGLMARGDITLYGSKDRFSTTSFGLGADYTYHFERAVRGPYVLAGASFINFNTSIAGSSTTNNGLGLDLGVGYDIDRHLGFQARYQSHSVNDGTYSSLNLGVGYTW